MIKPGDFVKAILQTKEDLIKDSESEKEYLPHYVNKALSYHYDCLFYANEMNLRNHIDNKLQFHFHINTSRSKKRPFVEWVKSEKNEDIECVKKVFGFSDAKAKEALVLLNKDQIQELKEQTEIGGLRK